MAGNTSTIPAAIESLLGHLANVANESALLGIIVYDGMPIENTADYVLAVSGYDNHTQRWATTSGYFSRWEEYDLLVTIHCWGGDTAPDDRRDECFTLLEALVQELLTDKNGGGALTMSGDWSVVDTSAVQGPVDGAVGWGIDMTVTIHCENIFLTTT